MLQFRDRVGELTAASVQEAARSTLTMDRYIQVVLLPETPDG